MVLLVGINVHAGLNDTGVTTVDGGAPAGQDAQIGRDPAAAAGALDGLNGLKPAWVEVLGFPRGTAV